MWHSMTGEEGIMDRMSLTIDGMSCDRCVGAVAEALEGIDGVRLERLGVGSAVVEYDTATVEAARIRAAVSGEAGGVRSMERAS